MDYRRFWLQIQERIDKIYLAHNVLNLKEYSELYTLTYNYCVTYDHEHRVHSQNQDFNSLIHPLYVHVQNYFENLTRNLVKKFRGKSRKILLKELSNEWSIYTQFGKLLNNVLSYVNRGIVYRANKDKTSSNKTLIPMYWLALRAWRENILMEIHHNLIESLLSIIREDRCGNPVDRSMLFNIINSFIELGFGDIELNALDVTFYHEVFEQEFLRDTKTFYENESKNVLLNDSFANYLAYAAQRFLDEERRVFISNGDNNIFRPYIHKSTYPALINICTDTMVEEHKSIFRLEIRNVVESESCTDLKYLYTITAASPIILEDLQKEIEQHIEKQGSEAIDLFCIRQGGSNERISIANENQSNESLSSKNSLRNENVNEIDDKIFIETIVNIYYKYQDLLKNAFSNSKKFNKSLEKACENFIKSNTITKKFGEQKPLQLLAKYYDRLLLKMAKTDGRADLEEQLAGASLIFHFIEDKDIFGKYYIKYLAERLIKSNEDSIDTEVAIVNTFREICGNSYTLQMQRMIKDVNVSTELNRAFQVYVHEKNLKMPLDAYIHVLSYGSWPFQKQEKIQMPNELITAINIFTNYYFMRHSGRKLDWLYHSSKAELMTSGFNKLYVLKTATLQMALLNQFNIYEQLTVKELHEFTQIPNDILISVLTVLLKLNLLKCNAGELNETAHLSVNSEFSHKKYIIKLNFDVISTAKRMQTKEMPKNLYEERRFVIEACIVRIMKSRQVMMHNDLVTEVINQMSMRFHPKIAVIKTCIEKLVEKEYIARDEELKNKYHYVS